MSKHTDLDIQFEATEAAKDMIRSRGNPHWHDLRDMFLLGFKRATEGPLKKSDIPPAEVTKSPEGKSE